MLGERPITAAESRPEPLPMSKVFADVKLYSSGWASWYLIMFLVVRPIRPSYPLIA